MDPMAVWTIIFVGALALMGALMFFFGDRLRPLNRAERERSDRAARENWGKENVH
jgi:hypothetical protein